MAFVAPTPILSAKKFALPKSSAVSRPARFFVTAQAEDTKAKKANKKTEDFENKEEFPTHVVNPYTSSSDQKAIKAAVKKMEKGAATFRAPKQEKKEDAMFTSDMMSSVFDTTHDEFPHGAEMTVPFSGPTSAADIKSAAKKSQGVYKKAGPAPPATPANKTFIGEAVQKSFETTAGESNYPQGNRDAAFKEPFLSQQEIRKRMKDQGL